MWPHQYFENKLILYKLAPLPSKSTDIILYIIVCFVSQVDNINITHSTNCNIYVFIDVPVMKGWNCYIVERRTYILTGTSIYIYSYLMFMISNVHGKKMFTFLYDYSRSTPASSTRPTSYGHVTYAPPGSSMSDHGSRIHRPKTAAAILGITRE